MTSLPATEAASGAINTMDGQHSGIQTWCDSWGISACLFCVMCMLMCALYAYKVRVQGKYTRSDNHRPGLTFRSLSVFLRPLWVLTQFCDNAACESVYNNHTIISSKRNDWNGVPFPIPPQLPEGIPGDEINQYALDKNSIRYANYQGQFTRKIRTIPSYITLVWGCLRFLTCINKM